MRQFMMATLAVAVAVSLAGCKSAEVSSERSPYDIMQEKANAITDAGGLAAVGTGTSRTISLAIDKAKTRARTELAHMIETKIDSLKKDFTEEIGEGADSEYNALFSTASKSIAHQILRGTVAKDVKYVTEGGQTTAYALMVQDPKIIAEAFEDQKNTAKALYTRFRASQAFAELDSEVKKFEEFKARESGAMMGQ